MAVDVISKADRQQSVDSVSLRDYVDSRLSDIRDLLANLARERGHLVDTEIKRVDGDRVQAVKMAAQRFEAMEKTVETVWQRMDSRFTAVQDASKLMSESIGLRFESISKATDLAREANDRRLEGMNEFREQMSDMTARYISRSDVENANKFLGDRLSINETRLAQCITRAESETTQAAMGERVSGLEKVSNNLQGRMWAVAAIVVIVEIAISFLKAH